uniref:Uncharacterized protein n=1 Tax=Manihot esculenta TaxID=3983 RepID=A0A2C9WE53_MANES
MESLKDYVQLKVPPKYPTLAYIALLQLGNCAQANQNSQPYNYI